MFTTSPPEITEEDPESVDPDISSKMPEESATSEQLTEETLTEITEGIELSKLSYSELQSLAESLSSKASKTSSKEDWTVSKSKRLDLNLDGKAGTYSRRRAEKLKQRQSWDDQSNQETLELQDLTR